MKTMAGIRATSPFPWTYNTQPTGRVVVFDARGVEVPMFDLIELACGVTHGAVRAESSAAAPKAASA